MDPSSTRRLHERRCAARPAIGVPGQVDAGLGRFLYYVQPGADGWELLFGFEGTRFTFADEGEALAAARMAAKLHWETLCDPSGVYLVSPSAGRRLLEIYGTRD